MARILVVDDEEQVRLLLEEILERKSYGCTLAVNAAQARERLQEQNFELVISDIKMPGESGLEFIRYVLAQYPDTATVIVTVMGELSNAEEALEMGVYGYIIKPFESNQILISVGNALRRRELERAERYHLNELEKAVQERTAELVNINEQLRAREAELHRQAEELKEVNSALRVLLKARDEDKAELEQRVLSNIKKGVEPYLERLKQSGLTNAQMTYLGILESNLKDIVAPFARELSSKYLGLTPTEIQVALLIKQGKRTKEIASLLYLSQNTILTHRYKIRTKLGLKNKKTNLRSYLQRLT